MQYASLPTAGLLLLLASGIAAAQSIPDADKETVPLTSVALVADLDLIGGPDDPSAGGGFETAAYFQTRLADARVIQDCSARIEQASTDWANELALVRSLRDQNSASLTLHYAKTNLLGFFAINYRIENGIKARVRVDFVLLDGSERSPELAHDLLENFRIASFQDTLDIALKCKGQAS